MNVNITCYDDSLQRVLHWTSQNCGHYVCVSNVHMCMETFDDPAFLNVVNEADLVVPDGRPLVWAQKALGNTVATQVRGSNLLIRICEEAEKKNLPVGLYGGTKDSLSNFLTFLNRRFPALQIPFYYSPPFRPLTEIEDPECVERINTSGVKVLFVGIGCPKQEKWMAAHKACLNCVMIGVGAAFDFFSGQKKHAPIWMQKTGLEWLFRLANEPKRLWKRYLRHNPRFIYHFLKQLRV